jgi:demethylspheroidene O-methyltransferase
MSARTEFFGGDFTADMLPRGADVVSFVRVLHDHDDATVARLLLAAHDALPRGGDLLIAEPLADTAGARRMGDAYFGLYLRAMGRGRPRRREELAHVAHRGVRAAPGVADAGAAAGSGADGRAPLKP